MVNHTQNMKQRCCQVWSQPSIECTGIVSMIQLWSDTAASGSWLGLNHQVCKEKTLGALPAAAPLWGRLTRAALLAQVQHNAATAHSRGRVKLNEHLGAERMSWIELMGKEMIPSSSVLVHRTAPSEKSSWVNQTFRECSEPKWAHASSKAAGILLRSSWGTSLLLYIS